MGKRTNTARWVESKNHWRIDVQKDNMRKTFYSNLQGRTGQREANAKADQWLDENIVNQKYKVEELCIEWIQEIKETTGTLNHRQIKNIIDNYIVPCKGQKYISKLVEQDIQDIINYAFTHPKRKNEKLSKKYLSNIRNASNAMLKYARKRGLTKLKPEDISIPAAAKRGHKQALTPDDIGKLFKYDQTWLYNQPIFDWYIYAYRLYVITGLRVGELVGLKHTDIKGNILTVNRSVNELLEITDGKNENAHRSLRLPLLAIKIINNQRNMLIKADIKSEWLFCDINGDMIKPHSLNKRWGKYRDYNNLSNVSLYELRHTLVSICKGKIEKEALEPYIGHSENMDTYNDHYYGHEFDDGRYNETAMTINNLFFSILEKCGIECGISKI